MSRHPIYHLVPSILAIVFLCFSLGLCLALALLADQRDAGSIVVTAVFGTGASLYFIWHAIAELRRAWRPFIAGLNDRRQLRRSAPLTRINLSKEDVQ